MLPGDFRLPKLSIKQLLLLGALGLAGLAMSVAAIVAVGFVIPAWFGLPLGVFGVVGIGGAPDQPIAFPHTVHVQEVGLDCTFCHRNVAIGAAATIPAVGLCMTCHKTVGGGIPEVEKLRSFDAAGSPIDWVRVHRVPDHVHFVHEAHLRYFSGRRAVVDRITDPGQQIRLDDARKVQPGSSIGDTIDIEPSAVCSICHGDVASMVKVKQVRSLKMGDCVDCHRDNSAPTDCTTCHY